MRTSEEELKCLLAELEPEDIEPVPECMGYGVTGRWKQRRLETDILRGLGLRNRRRLLSLAVLVAAFAAVLTACTFYVVQKLQFAPGFGINDRLEEPLYTTQEQVNPVLEEQGITVELLSLTYQAETMTARLRITDREGRYEAIRREKEGVWPRFAGPTTVITGLSFDRERLWELPKQEKNGGNRYELELFMEDKSVEIEEGGTYEIIMPGMDGVLTFPMKKADTYESLQEIGDCDIHGNKAILAFAGNTKKGVTVRTYTYSSDGTRVLPVPLLYGMTGEDGIRLEIGNRSCPWEGKYQEGEAVFTGVGVADAAADSGAAFKQGSAMLFSDAEGEMGDRPVLSIPGLLFEADEESGEITIPIPGEGGDQEADGKAEFAYAEVGIESAETFKEPKEEVLEAIYPITVILSDANGRKLSTKTLSMPKKLKINLAVRNRDGKTELYDLICERSVKQTGHADANGWQENEKIRDAETGAVTGYLIPYREGDREVKIRFRRPVFYYRQRFRIPLEADGIAGSRDVSSF